MQDAGSGAFSRTAARRRQTAYRRAVCADTQAACARACRYGTSNTRSFSGSEASLHASEVAFEYVVDAQGCSTVITGKIDRIDTAGGYFRVVDYKSSAARFDPDAFAAGTALQLPVYIDAARRLPAQQGFYRRAAITCVSVKNSTTAR